jgi:hypothetical protein
VAGGGRLDDSALRGPAATVFVTDPTAEAERVAQSLRAAGYAVVDVPLSLLVARVAVQRPRVILIDADSDGALDAVARVRELPNAVAIEILFLARPGGAIASPEEAIVRRGSGLFVRPVEVASLVRKVETLTGRVESSEEGAAADSRGPPPSIPTSSQRRSGAPPSLPPASMRLPSAAAPASQVPQPRAQGSRTPPESTMSGVAARRMVGLAHPVSPELQRLLAAAEQRAQADGEPDSIAPSPEDEIEAVLPAELLAALDEPLEEDEDDEEGLAPARPLRASVGVREGTNDGGGSRTTGTSGATGTPTTGGGARGTPAHAVTSDPGLTPPPPPPTPYTHAGFAPTTGAESRPRAAVFAPPAPDILAVLGPGDALGVVARAVAARRSGSLCFSTPEAERRLVLREGDVVTLASTSEDESLLAFLGVRGDLPKETVRRLASKFPPFGRHAGAALVARGYLRQDQMWPTLRAHAEWLLARLLQLVDAQVALEPQPPGRLAGEPAVFGGATGAEVFVEVVRRIVPPAGAVERLGGLGARVSEGHEARLLGECALGRVELDQVEAMAGRSLREVLDDAPEGDLATVVFALAELGVLDVLPGVSDAAGLDASGAMADVARVADLDSEALRGRVRARMQLVDDGDYFSLLGVPREATGYEVRRAFLELRRAFDPSRVLTPEIADLADDVRKITGVLEEAYDILKDAARRDRYRRAIEGTPA